MAIKYIYPPTGEFSLKEPWEWVAVYKDGTTLEQFEAKAGVATFHRFAEIDQSRLAHFKMIGSNGQQLSILFDSEGMKLVHFYRNQHLKEYTGGYDDDGDALMIKRDLRIYYFGYQDNAGLYHLTGILPDGRIIISNDRDHTVDLREAA